MSIRCGACKGRHDTVAQVRLCAERGRRSATGAQVAGSSQAVQDSDRVLSVEQREEPAPVVRRRRPVPQVEVTVEVTPLGIRKETRRDPVTGRGTVYSTMADIPCSEDDPCDGKNYHVCNAHRAQNAAFSGDWRDRFRAYND